MYLSGMGFTAIARKLNDEGIPCPSVYKKQKNSSYESRAKADEWYHMSIKLILTSPVYMGTMAQNKYKRVSYKSKKQIVLDREDWVVVDYTHEPIISSEDFEHVQNLIYAKGAGLVKPKRNCRLFTGLAFCGDCGSYMTYIKVKSNTEYLICSSYKRFGKERCSRHSISEEGLKQIILKKLRELIQKYSDVERLKKEATKVVKLAKVDKTIIKKRYPIYLVGLKR